MKFNIALIQHKINSNHQKNRELLAEKIYQAKQQAADIIVLPELHDNLYFCQTKNPEYFQLAIIITKDNIQHYTKLSEQLKVTLVISIFEKTIDEQYYNTALVIEDGKVIGKYRKHNIPSCQEYNEAFYFSSSNKQTQPIQTKFGKIGILICYDQWFPESARTLALQGADIIVIPTAIGFNPLDEQSEQQRQLDAWLTIQRSHSIANCLPLAVCNRVGFEQHPIDNTGIEFWGHSFITGDFGEIIASTSSSAAIIMAEIDTDTKDSTRAIWPFLTERKTSY